MDKNSRKWFNNAYSYSRKCFLPFSVFTQEISPEESKIILDVSEDSRAVEKLCSISKFFVNEIPPIEDFYEEKERVFKKLIPFLKKRIPYVDAAIAFGRTIGDIDIGLVSSKLTDQELFSSLQPGFKTHKKYPLVDWESLFYFRSKTGHDVGLKILESRREVIGSQVLDSSEKNYVKQTLIHSKLLYGDNHALESLKGLEIIS